MILVNCGEVVNLKDWVIYFYSICLIFDVGNDQFKIICVTGDLYKLEFIDKFDGFVVGEMVILLLIGEYWMLFEMDFMLCVFVIVLDVELKVIVVLNIEDVVSFVSGLEGENFKCILSDNNVFV